jgi:hypothetical protein
MSVDPVCWQVLPIQTHKHVREGAPEEGAIDGSMPAAFRAVNVFAPGAVELDCFLEGEVG